MKNGKLVVSSGNAEYAIPVMDAAQYPRMEIPCPAATVPVSGIPSLTKRTAFAVSEDTTRPMLKCVNLIFGADGLQAVSTDSFRIASAKGDRESRGNISFLVPAASLEKLAGLVERPREIAGRHDRERPLCLRKENFSFAARIMEGPYLAVSQVLSNLKQQFTVLTDAALLRDTILQALSVTGTQNRFSLSFAGNRLTVRCESEYGISETAMDVVALSGEPAGVYWYNPAQLMECLKALNGTLMLEVVQHSALLLKTDELVCFQMAVREPKAIEVESPKRQKSRARRRHKKGGHAYLKKPTICRYCGGIIRLVPAADVYGSSTERLGMQNEYLYQCQNCNARVGCHKGTTRPLGDVANEILRLKRIEAHQVFDAYWQKQHISRTKAYQWLARELKLPEEDTHIGGFEIDTCQRVIDLCRAKMDKK